MRWWAGGSGVGVEREGRGSEGRVVGCSVVVVVVVLLVVEGLEKMSVSEMLRRCEGVGLR